MRTWCVLCPDFSEYAEMCVRSTWHDRAGHTGLCRECHRSMHSLGPPFEIEWEKGSDRIGDFSWHGGWPPMLVPQRVVEDLARHFSGFELVPVSMYQAPRRKRPKIRTKRSVPRVWLPYEGPPVVMLHVTKQVHMDSERSTAVLELKCGTCPYEKWELTGYEWVSLEWDPQQAKLESIHQERVPGQGLFVHDADLQPDHLFKVHERGGVFCVDAVKVHMEARGYTNIEFLEFGDAV